MAIDKVAETPAVTRTLSEATEPPPLAGQLPRRSHLPRVEFKLEERRRIRYLLSVVAAVVASWTVRLMPDPLRRYCATKGGDLWYRLAHRYRRSVVENMRQVLGTGASDRDLESAARNIFRTSGRNLADLLLVPHLSSSDIVGRLKLVAGTWSYLDDAVAEGKGVLLVTGHLGAFDFVGQALHQRGYKLTSVTGRTTNRFLFDAVTFLRRSHDMRLVEASHSGIRQVFRALRRGECAVFLADLDFFQNGKVTRLFGRETTLPPGAVRIARDTGAPIVPVFGVRTGRGHGLIIEPPFRVEKTGDIDADISRGLARIAESLERAIGSAPDQWVMFQAMWPSEPASHGPASQDDSPWQSA